MNKILAVAEQEFRAMVRSKAFLISIVIVPLMMVVSSVAQRQLSSRADRSPRKIAVVDASGRWFDAVARRAEERNRELGELKHDDSLAPYVPVRIEPQADRDAQRLQLSDEVKHERLYAFVEIAAEPDVEPLRYYTEHPAADDVPRWLAKVVDDELREQRYRSAHLDDATVSALRRHVEADRLGLWTRDPDGHIHPAEKLDVIKALIVPIVPSFLLFFFIVVSAPQLVNSVLTEKMSRISEVLLGSLSPFELMAGKLLGSVAVALLLGAVYLVGGVTVAARMGFASAVPPSLLAWFLVFLVLAMLMYGSISIAVGAACTDLKDAQSMIMPIMLPLMLPMFLLTTVLESPSSSLSTALSLFPLSAPLTMMLRVGVHPAAPLWQVVLAAVLVLATAIACVWAAGRIFRVGLLMQGKSASLGQMLRWVFRG